VHRCLLVAHCAIGRGSQLLSFEWSKSRAYFEHLTSGLIQPLGVVAWPSQIARPARLCSGIHLSQVILVYMTCTFGFVHSDAIPTLPIALLRVLFGETDAPQFSLPWLFFVPLLFRPMPRPRQGIAQRRMPRFSGPRPQSPPRTNIAFNRSSETRPLLLLPPLHPAPAPSSSTQANDRLRSDADCLFTLRMLVLIALEADPTRLATPLCPVARLQRLFALVDHPTSPQRPVAAAAAVATASYGPDIRCNQEEDERRDRGCSRRGEDSPSSARSISPPVDDTPASYALYHSPEGITAKLMDLAHHLHEQSEEETADMVGTGGEGAMVRWPPTLSIPQPTLTSNASLFSNHPTFMHRKPPMLPVISRNRVAGESTSGDGASCSMWLPLHAPP